jgi:protein gp37
MAENSSIEWCDNTFNPWVGCTKISPACDHCYAESWAKRAGNPQLWQGERRRTSKANWQLPIKWNAQAKRENRRLRVFCASLADVFDNQIDPDIRNNLWDLIYQTPHLDWLLLTKRPQNIAKMLPDSWGDGWPNVWLGTTVENQTEAERRIPLLLDVPAQVHFLSCEPLLGPVNLNHLWSNHGEFESCLIGCEYSPFSKKETLVPRIDWVICGGESGPGARPMHPDWARRLRDQCAEAGVPFLFKQWGEWAPEEAGERRRQISDAFSATPLRRAGKKAAGRLLDGRTHDAFPERMA